MAGSLQARAEKYGKEELPSVDPTACPQTKDVYGSWRHCIYVYGRVEVAMCPYLYGLTDPADSTVRWTTAEIAAQMNERAMAHLEVRVLCLLAKPVDVAGA